jgi:hypothetical protein
MAILPPDQVGWRASLTADFYDNSLAINIADMASSDYQLVADYSVHRRPPSPRLRWINFADDASRQVGPKVAFPGQPARVQAPRCGEAPSLAGRPETIVWVDSRNFEISYVGDVGRTKVPRSGPRKALPN